MDPSQMMEAFQTLLRQTQEEAERRQKEERRQEREEAEERQKALMLETEEKKRTEA